MSHAGDTSDGVEAAKANAVSRILHLLAEGTAKTVAVEVVRRKSTLGAGSWREVLQRVEEETSGPVFECGVGIRGDYVVCVKEPNGPRPPVYCEAVEAARFLNLRAEAKKEIEFLLAILGAKDGPTPRERDEARERGAKLLRALEVQS